MSKRRYFKTLLSRLVWSISLVAIAIGIDIIIRHLGLDNLIVGIILFIGGWLLIGWNIEEGETEDLDD